MTKDVHTEHCCIKHGCKYSIPNCSVVTGKKKQSFPCEICDLELEREAPYARDVWKTVLALINNGATIQDLKLMATNSIEKFQKIILKGESLDD